MSTRKGRALIVLLSSVAMGCLVFLDAGGPLRTAVTFWFVLACPGIAIATAIPVAGWVETVLIAVATSLVVDTLVATFLLIAGVFDPGLGLAILVSLCGLGSAALLFHSRDPRGRTVVRIHV